MHTGPRSPQSGQGWAGLPAPRRCLPAPGLPRPGCLHYRRAHTHETEACLSATAVSLGRRAGGSEGTSGSQHANWVRRSRVAQGFGTLDMTVDDKSVALVRALVQGLHKVPNTQGLPGESSLQCWLQSQLAMPCLSQWMVTSRCCPQGSLPYHETFLPHSLNPKLEPQL